MIKGATLSQDGPRSPVGGTIDLVTDKLYNLISRIEDIIELADV